MADNVLSVLTFKSISTILAVGGTQSWALDRLRARHCKYVVVCRNGNHAEVEGEESHGEAFMIGKVKDVIPSTEIAGRWLVTFSEYAVGSFGYQWEGRNPVAYWTTSDYDDIDFEAIDFTPMPEPTEEADIAAVAPLTLLQAKAGLSRGLCVPESSIEIIIRA